jgi:hypothetical protein
VVLSELLFYGNYPNWSVKLQFDRYLLRCKFLQGRIRAEPVRQKTVKRVSKKRHPR